MIRPHFWSHFNYTGRAIVLSLFVIGVWHLATRLREYLQHYTYRRTAVRNPDDEKPEQPYTRFAAYTFLLVGYALSVVAGIFIGWHAQEFFDGLSMLFRHRAELNQSNMFFSLSTLVLIPDLVIYPPIAVLIVDGMHSIISRMD